MWDLLRSEVSHGGLCFMKVALKLASGSWSVILQIRETKNYPLTHPQTHFHQCSSTFPQIGCEMFSNQAAKTASTVSLSILVVIEMLNAMNGLSSSQSLLSLPLWRNMMLVYAITLSMVLHFILLYTPVLQRAFSIVPLGWPEWKIVLAWSAPIIPIDELLKYLEREFFIETTSAPMRKKLE